MPSFSHNACCVHWITLLFIPLWINFSSVNCSGQTKLGRRVALLVACEQYQPQLENAGQKKLESPRKDMELLERELKHLAYEVRRIEGDSTACLDKGRIVSQIEEFISGIQIQDEVLVYLSGHGVQLYGDRYDGLYFVPEQAIVDDLSGLEDPGDDFYIENTLISIAWIADLLDKRQANNLVMILDCCRTKAKSTNQVGKKSPRTSSAKRVNIVYATSEGQAAFESIDTELNILEIEGIQRNKVRSKFTSNLIKYLRGECSPDDYQTDKSGDKILELDDALTIIERNLRDQAPSSFGKNNRKFTLGKLPAYTWDIQQYTTGLEPRINVQLANNSVPLEFLLVNPTVTPEKKIQLVDKTKYEKKSYKVDVELQMPFFLSATEISRQNWIDCLENPIAAKYLNSIQAPSSLQSDLLNRFKKQATNLNMPAQCTWPEALILCQLMTKKLDPNLDGFYKICSVEMSRSISKPCLTGIEFEFKPNAYGFRLPTEAQWHWAVFQDKDPIGIIKAASGQLRALQNGAEVPIAPVDSTDPHEPLTCGFRYALGNMAEWMADDWYRTDSRSLISPIHGASNCGKQRKLGDKFLKGAGVLDTITDQRRQSKPGALDTDHGLRILYQPAPHETSR